VWFGIYASSRRSLAQANSSQKPQTDGAENMNASRLDKMSHI